MTQLNGRDCSGGGTNQSPTPISYARLDPYFNSTLAFNYTGALLNNAYFTCPWSGTYNF